MFTFVRALSSPRRLPAVLILCLAGMAALLPGCAEPVTLYHVPGSEAYLAQGRKILILPFMDTRTFTTREDQDNGDIGNYTRDIFVEALREFNADQVVELMTPRMPRRTRSLTNAEVAVLGREHGADLVVAGQIFSFADTRAASIPPRAGMFVRIINAHDGALLFAGDHYRAAGFPGADGGRELQALFVSSRLIEGFLSRIQPAVMAAGDIASVGAFAMLAPKPVTGKCAFIKRRDPAAPAWKLFSWNFGRGDSKIHFENPFRQTDNREGERGTKPSDGKDARTPREPGNVPETERYLGMTASFLFSPDQWDEQFIPEVPPLVDFEEDFYQVSPATMDSPEPLPPPEELIAEAEGELSEDIAEASVTEEEHSTPEAAQQDLAEAVPTEKAAMPEEEQAVPYIATDVYEPSAEDNGPVYSEVLSGLDLAYYYGLLPEPVPADAPVDTAAAEIVHELSEIDMSRVYPNMIPADMPFSTPTSSLLSGDELASDLFARNGDVWEVEPRPVAMPTPSEFDMAPETPSLLQQPITPIPSGSGGFRTVKTANGIRLATPDDLADDGTLITAARARPRKTIKSEVGGSSSYRVRNQSVKGATAARGDGSVLDEPVAVGIPGMPPASEQPRTFKSVDRILKADPYAVMQEPAALVAMPGTGAADGIRVLLLPYHERDNPDNLIYNHGGGEVVTTLFGTQLAADAGITVMWDASGQATHNRLVSREEALEMGRRAGADYVVRGQILEFRRAQSVPSLYSVVISTAVLAAQLFFAEMSGVDVATEIYRVSDGLCVMSRRDRSYQKYVVQAEKTVRRMAALVTNDVGVIVRSPQPQPMDPLIDALTPETLGGGAEL